LSIFRQRDTGTIILERSLPRSMLWRSDAARRLGCDTAQCPRDVVAIDGKTSRRSGLKKLQVADPYGLGLRCPAAAGPGVTGCRREVQRDRRHSGTARHVGDRRRGRRHRRHGLPAYGGTLAIKAALKQRFAACHEEKHPDLETGCLLQGRKSKGKHPNTKFYFILPRVVKNSVEGHVAPFNSSITNLP
jgi:hypothetical protein